MSRRQILNLLVILLVNGQGGQGGKGGQGYFELGVNTLYLHSRLGCGYVRPCQSLNLQLMEPKEHEMQPYEIPRANGEEIIVYFIL